MSTFDGKPMLRHCAGRSMWFVASQPMRWRVGRGRLRANENGIVRLDPALRNAATTLVAVPRTGWVV